MDFDFKENDIVKNKYTNALYRVRSVYEYTLICETFDGNEDVIFRKEDLEIVGMVGTLEIASRTDVLVHQNETKIETESTSRVINSKGGMKDDGKKVSYTHLLKDLPDACESVTKVLMMGAAKYARCNWSKVEDERYEDAMLRHLMAHLRGETKDSESGEPHMAHIVCCAMFVLQKSFNKGDSN